MLKSVSMVPAIFAALTEIMVSPVAAQTAAGCPAAGIVETAKSNLGEYTIKQLGPDVSGGSICASDVEGQGAVFRGQQRKIYAWYDLTNYTMSSSDEEVVQKLLGDFLSGHTNEVSFSIVMGRSGKPWSWSSTQVWQRIAQDLINVGRQTITTTHLRYESKPGGGAGDHHVVWDLWYDPVRHLFLKGHATVISGTQVTTDFVVTSISGP